MKTKKNPKFDLEVKRKTLFTIGLVISLTMVLLAFKSGSEIKETTMFVGGTYFEPEPIALPVFREHNERKIALPEFKLIDELQIVDDNTETVPFDVIFDELDAPLPNPVPFKEKNYDPEIVFFPEDNPEFPGGMESLNHWLRSHTNYPKDALELGLSGRVYLNFIVDKQGNISDIKVIRGIDPLLDNEAIRVVSAMPKWKPGMQNKIPVNVSFSLYITFSIK